MLDTPKVLPPTIAPPTRPLSILQSIRAARRNVLEIIPELAYRQPMVSGRMGARWHMVQDPGALRRVLLDNVENFLPCVHVGPARRGKISTEFSTI